MGGNKGEKGDSDNSKGKSRPSSQSGENRLSLTLSRLTGRVSKDKLGSAPSATVTEGVATADGEDPASTHTVDEATNFDGTEAGPTGSDDPAQAAQPGLLTPGFTLSKEKTSDGATSLLGRRKSRFGRGDKDKDKDESKKERKEKSRLRSKSKDPDAAVAAAMDEGAEENGGKEKHAHHHHHGSLGHQHKHKGRPDRECTVM